MRSMRRTVFKFGLFAGAVMSVMLVATVPFMDRIDLDRGQWIGYASMVGAFLLVFAAVRTDREAAPAGRGGFWRALAVGTLTVFVASACYTATWEVVYFRFYRTSFPARYQAHEAARLRAEGASAAAVEARLAELRRFAMLYDHPAANAAITFLEPLPVGLLMAITAAATQRRRRAAATPRDRAPTPGVGQATTG